MAVTTEIGNEKSYRLSLPRKLVYLQKEFPMTLRCLFLFFFLVAFPVWTQTDSSVSQAGQSLMLVYGQTDRRLVQPAVKQFPDRPKRYALVIGVDQYQDTQITTLGGAANDARTLANALIQYAGFPPEQVTLLATDQPAERQPTRGNILRRLSNMRGAVPQDGMLLVAFAGHGMERSGQAYLLPSDSQVSGDIRLLEETAIHVNRMRAAIKETGVKQVLLILDACRNDPAGRANADNPLTQAYTGGFNFDVRNQEVNAFVTLYATAVGQRAYEYKEKRQGYFTWELVEALKGQAANERGEVTLAGLVRHLQTQVPKRVKLELGKDQLPYVVIDGYKADELVIAVKGKVLSDSIYKEPAMPVTPTVSALDPAAIELELWNSIKSSADPGDFRVYLEKYPQGIFAELARRRARLGETAAPTATNSSPAMLTVDQLLDRYLQAVGGKAAFEKLTSRVAKGSFVKIQGTTNITGAFESYAKAPNKAASIQEVGNGKVQQIFDGTVGWIKYVRGGANQISGERLAQVRREFDFYREINLREIYPRMTLIRKDKVGDRETYVIEAVPHDGKPDTIYFDAQTGLLVRRDGVIEGEKGKFYPTEMYFEDYREVDGVKLPFMMRQTFPSYNVTDTFKFYEIKHNVLIDDAKFKKP